MNFCCFVGYVFCNFDIDLVECFYYKCQFIIVLVNYR